MSTRIQDVAGKKGNISTDTLRFEIPAPPNNATGPHTRSPSPVTGDKAPMPTQRKDQKAASEDDPDSSPEHSDKDEGLAAGVAVPRKYERTAAQKKKRKDQQHKKAVRKKPFKDLAGWKPGDPFPDLDGGMVAALMAHVAGQAQGTTTPRPEGDAENTGVAPGLSEPELARLIRSVNTLKLPLRAALLPPLAASPNPPWTSDTCVTQEHPGPHNLHPGARSVGCIFPVSTRCRAAAGQVAGVWCVPFRQNCDSSETFRHYMGADNLRGKSVTGRRGGAADEERSTACDLHNASGKPACLKS